MKNDEHMCTKCGRIIPAGEPYQEKEGNKISGDKQYEMISIEIICKNCKQE